MDLASEKLNTCGYSVETYCRKANAIHVSLPYGLEEHDLSVTSEVEPKNEIIYTPAVGVARSKGTVRNESFITSLEVLRDHWRINKLSEVSCVQR